MDYFLRLLSQRLPNQQQNVPNPYLLANPPHQPQQQHRPAMVRNPNDPFLNTGPNSPMAPAASRNVANVAPFQQTTRTQSPQQSSSSSPFMLNNKPGPYQNLAGAGGAPSQQPDPAHYGRSMAQHQHPPAQVSPLDPAKSSAPNFVNQFGDADDRLIMQTMIKGMGSGGPSPSSSFQNLPPMSSQYSGLSLDTNTKQPDIGHMSLSSQHQQQQHRPSPNQFAHLIQQNPNAGSASTQLGNKPKIADPLGPPGNLADSDFRKLTRISPQNVNPQNIPGPSKPQIFSQPPQMSQHGYSEMLHEKSSNQSFGHQIYAGTSTAEQKLTGQTDQKTPQSSAPLRHTPENSFSKGPPRAASPSAKIHRGAVPDEGEEEYQSLIDAAEDIFGGVSRNSDSLQRIISHLQILSETGGISSDELLEKLADFSRADNTTSSTPTEQEKRVTPIQQQQKPPVSAVAMPSNPDDTLRYAERTTPGGKAEKTGFDMNKSEKKGEIDAKMAPNVASTAPLSSNNDVLSSLLDTLSQYATDLHKPAEPEVREERYGNYESLAEMQYMYESVMDRVWEPGNVQKVKQTESVHQEPVIDHESYEKKKDEKYQELEESFRRQQAATMYDKLVEKKAEYTTQISTLETRKVEIDKLANSLSVQLSDLKKQHGLMCRRAQRKNAVDENEFLLMEENGRLQQDIEQQLVKMTDDRTSIDSNLENTHMKLKRCEADLNGLQKMAKIESPVLKSTETPPTGKTAETPQNEQPAKATRSKSRDDSSSAKPQVRERASRSPSPKAKKLKRRSKSKSRDRRSRSSGSASKRRHRKKKPSSKRRNKSRDRRSRSRSRSPRKRKQKKSRSRSRDSSPRSVKSDSGHQKTGHNQSEAISAITSSPSSSDSSVHCLGEEVKNKSPARDLKKPPAKSRWDDGEKEFDKFMYYDAGFHWCKLCSTVCTTLPEMFDHLHSAKHKTFYVNKPWHDDAPPKEVTNPGPSTQVIPLKGVEFLTGCSAFYCALCKDFAGDGSLAEEHLKSFKHNEKYQVHIQKNPTYEKCFLLEKAAFMASNKITAFPMAKSYERAAAIVKAAQSNLNPGPQKKPHVPSVSGKVEPFKLKSKDEKVAELLKPAPPVFENAKINFDVTSNPDAANITDSATPNLFPAYQTAYYGPYVNPPGVGAKAAGAADSSPKNSKSTEKTSPSKRRTLADLAGPEKPGDDKSTAKTDPKNAKNSAQGTFKMPQPPSKNSSNVFGKHKPQISDPGQDSSSPYRPRTYYPQSNRYV